MPRLASKQSIFYAAVLWWAKSVVCVYFLMTIVFANGKTICLADN